MKAKSWNSARLFPKKIFSGSYYNNDIIFLWAQYSTSHGHCSTYSCINCLQYSGFPRKINAKKHVYIFTWAFTRRLFTHKFETSIFTVTDFANKNTCKLCVFLYNIKCGWCKIRNRHCAKTSFRAEKENTLLYTFSYLSCYDHATIANIMFCNQWFPWLLAEALFYM